MNPFEALGLPVQRNLTDEQVRRAWRTIAAATHPDRRDGGDIARYTAASAAYGMLRTPWGRSEAYADVTEAAERTAPQPIVAGDYADGYRGPVAGEALAATGPGLRAFRRAHPGDVTVLGWFLLDLAWQLPARIWHGRWPRLLLRAVVAVVWSVVVLIALPGQPATVCCVVSAVAWFFLTGRGDLAPPREE